MPRRTVGVVQGTAGLPSAPARAVLDLLTDIVFDPSRLPPGLTAVPPDGVRQTTERSAASVGGRL